MPNNYHQYIEDVSDDIKTCLEGMGCQPILFVGSGLTKRYLSGPNWEELLQQLANECPNIDKRFAGNDSNLLIVFYVQIMPDDFVMQLHRF